MHESDPRTAWLVEECLAWIESDPVDVRARRIQFSNGIRAIRRVMQGTQWLILWEELTVVRPVVGFIDRSELL